MITNLSPLVLKQKELLSSLKKARRTLKIQKEKFEQAEKEQKIAGSAIANLVRKNIIVSFEYKAIRAFLSLPVQNIEGEKMRMSGTVFSNIFGISYADDTKITFGDYFEMCSSKYFYVKPTDIRKIGFTPTKKGLQKILSKIALASDRNIIIVLEEVRDVKYWGTEMGTLLFFQGLCRIKEEVLLK